MAVGVRVFLAAVLVAHVRCGLLPIDLSGASPSDLLHLGLDTPRGGLLGSLGSIVSAGVGTLGSLGHGVLGRLTELHDKINPNAEGNVVYLQPENLDSSYDAYIKNVLQNSQDKQPITYSEWVNKIHGDYGSVEQTPSPIISLGKDPASGNDNPNAAGYKNPIVIMPSNPQSNNGYVAPNVGSNYGGQGVTQAPTVYKDDQGRLYYIMQPNTNQANQPTTTPRPTNQGYVLINNNGQYVLVPASNYSPNGVQVDTSNVEPAQAYVFVPLSTTQSPVNPGVNYGQNPNTGSNLPVNYGQNGNTGYNPAGNYGQNPNIGSNPAGNYIQNPNTGNNPVLSYGQNPNPGSNPAGNYGQNPNTMSNLSGNYGQNPNTGRNPAVNYGQNPNTISNLAGSYGQNPNPGSNSAGIYGQNSNTGSNPAGNYGQNPNTGTDVSVNYGQNPNTGSNPAGSYGQNPNTGSNPAGSYGQNPNTGSNPAGSYGQNPNTGSNPAGSYEQNPNTGTDLSVNFGQNPNTGTDLSGNFGQSPKSGRDLSGSYGQNPENPDTGSNPADYGQSTSPEKIKVTTPKYVSYEKEPTALDVKVHVGPAGIKDTDKKGNSAEDTESPLKDDSAVKKDNVRK